MQEWLISKSCSCCGVDKPLKEFHKRKQLKSGYRAECKLCGCKRRSEYYKNNTEKSKSASSKWKSENKDKVKEYSKQYALDNNEAICIKRKTYHMTSFNKRKEYRLKYKDRYAFYKSNRRFLEKASCVYTDEWNLLIMQEAYSLSRLRSDLTNIKWHVDHIIPLNGKLVCGLHVGINLQVIPAFDNLSKSNKF